MMSQIRYQQQYQQKQSSNSIGTSSIVTYDRRDNLTGRRVVQSADGGKQYTQYLSNSIPQTTITSTQTSSIGLTSYINQRPH